MDVLNLYADAPLDLGQEQFSTLLEAGDFRMERIVSTGQSTPTGEWLDQDDNEWVLVLQGHAEISFEGDTGHRALEAGDHLHIPAHVRHRVEMTDPDRPTIWLALHYR